MVAMFLAVLVAHGLRSVRFGSFFEKGLNIIQYLNVIFLSFKIEGFLPFSG